MPYLLCFIQFDSLTLVHHSKAHVSTVTQQGRTSGSGDFHNKKNNLQKLIV